MPQMQVDSLRCLLVVMVAMLEGMPISGVLKKQKAIIADMPTLGMFMRMISMMIVGNIRALDLQSVVSAMSLQSLRLRIPKNRSILRILRKKHSTLKAIPCRNSLL